MTDESPPTDDKTFETLVDRRRFSARDQDFDGANDEALAIRLATLEEEHRDLDAAIRALEATAPL